ncbi:MAG: MG2 domain-containing protein, partial [Bryobacter sp.]|nr:MG2 domain-containing protein [Bryobacter sp.]
MQRALLIAALALVPMVAQEDEAEAHFSLSSDRTFAPGESPVVQLWAQDLKELEFRVYRVNDPIRFFTQLDEAHSFGGRAPKPAQEKTPLERFRAWKRGLQAQMRDSVRGQFTAEARAAFRESLTRGEQQPVKATGYAAVPLLNPQQMVATWKQAVGGKDRWSSQVVPVAVREPGVYLVEATDGKLRAFTIVNVSRFALITKTQGARVLARVVARDSGAPVAAAEVRIFAGNKELSVARTDGAGLAELTFEPVKDKELFVFAQAQRDFTVSTLSSYLFSRAGEGEELSGYVYTDRPVYRPGHSFGFRAILRAATPAGWKLPEAKEVNVEVQDPEGNAVFRRRLPVSSFGTVNGEFTLAAGAPLGYWSIEIRAGEANVSGNFEVQEYRKPEYEVIVTPTAKRVLQGSPITAEVKAKYFYGEPVTQAKVQLIVYRSRYWYPLWRDEDDEDMPEEQGMYGQEQILDEQRELDANGVLRVELPNEPGTHDLLYRIEARVTDAANRAIAGSNVVVAPFGSFLIHGQPDQYVFAPGAPARINVETIDYDGKPVAAAFRAELLEWTGPKKSEKVLAASEGQTSGTGKGSVSLTPPRAGSFRVRLSARTPEGRTVTDDTYVWVEGGGSVWSSGPRNRLEIVPDKKSYAPGETARVLLVTGSAGDDVLLTIEGRGLYERRTLKTKGSSTTVELPIRTEWQPNVFLNATVVRGNRLLEGSKILKVPANEKKLAVTLTPSKRVFQPGEPASYVIEAKDAGGKPAEAEFSLGVVDEAIYAVRREMLPELMSFFYGRTYSRVMTGSSFSYYFRGEAGKRALPLARLQGPSLAQLKPDRPPAPKVRKAFPDTVLWQAQIRTNAQGRAEAKLNFPDALTTWRATARGVTADTRVGSALDRVIVRKNLILRMATPRFFTEGDTVTIPMIVMNYLDQPQNVKLSLKAQGAEIVDGAEREVTVPARGEGKADIRVRALPGGPVVLTGQALAPGESDALELTMPVVAYGVKLAESRGGVLDGAEATVQLNFPASATPTARMLEIRITPSVAGALFGALDYLSSFPYGCVEQTLSSFVPNVVVRRTLQDLKVPAQINDAQLDQRIRAGLDRLLDFQHDDGGWGWWKTDESQVFMTAHVLASWQKAEAAGVRIPNEARARARQWLVSEMAKTTRPTADLEAYVASALDDATLLDKAWARRDKMTPTGWGEIGLAFARRKDARANEAAAKLEALAQTNEREAWWPSNRDDYLEFFGDTTPEATAAALKLLAAARPQSPLLDKAAFWLVGHRNEGFYWTSTKQTALVIDALSGYLQRSGELKPDETVTVAVNGREVLSKRFTAADALSPEAPVIRIPGAQLAATNQVRITRSGAGRVYWSARLDYASSDQKLQ